MHSRKEFLASSAFAAFVPAAAASPAAAATASPKPSAAPAIPPLAFDLAAFDAATGKAADHRCMFASTKLSHGVVLDAVKNTLDAYAATGAASASVATSVVLYHGASIALAFDDAVWRELLAPSISQAAPTIREDVADYRKSDRNPFRTARNAEDASVEGLVARGTHFYVCNHATEGFSYFLADATKRTPRAVYDRLVAGLLPGATLVPAGVWAVHALQERHFTYLQVTL